MQLNFNLEATPSAPVTLPATGKPYRQAALDLKRQGAAHAAGDALRAMYANLLAARMRGADPARIYAYLAHNDNLLERYRQLCDDVWAYTHALLTDPG